MTYLVSTTNGVLSNNARKNKSFQRFGQTPAEHRANPHFVEVESGLARAIVVTVIMSVTFQSSLGH